MIRIINLDNVSCCFDNKILLRDLNFNIEKGTFVSVVGSNGSGKSSLVRVLAGLRPYNGYINVNGYSLDKSNINEIRKKVRVVFSDIDNQFLGEKVLDELVVELENMGMDRKNIKIKLEYISNLFKINNILDKDVMSLTNSERQLIFIASALISDPDILILDDCMHQLTVKDKKLVFDILARYKKENKLTVIMVTHNMEDVLKSDRVIVLNKGKIVMDGSTISVLKQVENLNKLGLRSAFVVEMSLKLMKKGKINHIYLDMRKLVDALWK